MALSENQIKRYSRQIVLKEIGGIGQEKLLNSKITLIGLGALGSPVAYYLVAAGIGNLKIIDFDTVELSNLHRQILHFTNDLHRKKTYSAFQKLKLLNPDCHIELITDKFVARNAKELLKDADFVIDGSDNFPTKMLVNDTCIRLGIPFTIAGVLRFHGQIMTVIPEEKTACYRCIFGDLEGENIGMSCSEAGVVGFIPGILGSLEANEALKYLLNIGELIINKIMYIDILRNNFNFVDIYRNPDCIVCSDNAKDIVEIMNYGSENACR